MSACAGCFGQKWPSNRLQTVSQMARLQPQTRVVCRTFLLRMHYWIDEQRERALVLNGIKRKSSALACSCLLTFLVNVRNVVLANLVPIDFRHRGTEKVCEHARDASQLALA